MRNPCRIRDGGALNGPDGSGQDSRRRGGVVDAKCPRFKARQGRLHPSDRSTSQVSTCSGAAFTRQGRGRSYSPSALLALRAGEHRRDRGDKPRCIFTCLGSPLQIDHHRSELFRRNRDGRSVRLEERQHRCRTGSFVSVEKDRSLHDIDRHKNHASKGDIAPLPWHRHFAVQMTRGKAADGW